MDPNRPTGKSTAILLIAAAMGASGAMVLRAVVSAPEAPTVLELILFQVIVFILGLAGSYLFGQYSAHKTAQELLRLKARSSFRRVVSLYTAFQRLGTSIEQRRRVLREIAANNSDAIPVEHAEAAFDLLAVQVTEQIGTADDAAEDWRDLVPEEIERLEHEATTRQHRRGRIEH